MKITSLIKQIGVSTIVSVLLFSSIVMPSFAYEAPTAPSAPEAPQNTYEAPPAPENEHETEESKPEASPKAPTHEEFAEEQKQKDEQREQEKTAEETEAATEEQVTTMSDAAASETTGIAVNPTEGETTGGESASHGTGSQVVNTGNANSSALITTDANTNASGGGSQSADDITVANAGNGAGSTNAGEVNTNNNSTTIQNNDADVSNGVQLASVSGSNDASYNVGDSAIISGDANVTATVINGVNTNIDGVKVIEFNVDDTHTGDIVLAFPETTGCTATICNSNGTATVKNTGNGVGSDNTTAVNSTATDATFQNNDADIINDIVLVADSGHNDANYNTGGNSTIETGDASAVATVSNFVNNNIAGAGEVLLAVVNIFGDLVGNILLPADVVNGLAAGGSTTVANSGNGADSTNTAGVNSTNSDYVSQTNNANIANNIGVAATTGDNAVDYNTAGFENGGNVIDTGDASVDVNAVTIANNNVLDGATWWLVFVNDASGNWVGQIMGAPTGASMAGSTGTQFTVGADGAVTVANTGNGAGSENNAAVNQNNSNTTVQNNDANIVNNISLTANTGKNDASKNTGGNNSVTTGDANVMANILNFVNNNFVGGRVVVSVVNVFGSWLGSFVPPDQQAPQNSGTGGTDVQTNQSQEQAQTTQQNTDQNTSDDSNEQETTSSTQTTRTRRTAVAGTRSQGWGGVLAANTTGTGSEVTPGGIENDTTIMVPESPRVASVRTTELAHAWKIVALALGLLAFKTVVSAIARRKQATN